MRRAVSLLVLALVACGPKQPPGTGTGTGTGTGAGADAGTAAAAVPWEAAGIDWSRPPAPTAEAPWAPPVPEVFELASGATVLLVENHRLPLVSVRVVLTRAGSREDGARAGLAQLTGALIDEGAGARDGLALAEELERLGATHDVSVGADATTIWLDTLATTFADSLAVVADMIVRPTFAKADFVRVRDDQLAELALRPQEPRRIAALAFEELVFGDHPYGQPTAGFAATVERLTLADVKAFWTSRYAPATATIVVTGDVSRADAERVLGARLGGWKRKAPAAATPVAAPAARAPTVWLVDRPGAPQSVVMIGRAGPAAGDPQQLTAEVVNTAIGGSFAARLNRRLREELGYTYGMYATFWRGRWGGTWAITSALKTAHTVDGIREALAIIDAARAEAMPAAELTKAQQLMVRQLPQDFETNGGIAAQLTALIVQDLPADWHQGYVDGVRAVTADAARALADAAWAELSIVVVGDAAAVGDELASLGLPIVRVDADARPVR